MIQSPIADAMTAKLINAFSPVELAVIDESHLHAGHLGAREHAAEHGSAESHFRIAICSAAFGELSRLARHQAVMGLLAEEIAQIHAISLDITAP